MSVAIGTVSMATSGSTGFQTAPRVNRSLTASLERRLLLWMAERAPNWVTSDQLTVMGLAAQVGAGICFAWSREYHHALALVIVCIIVNWLGDSLDGTLARVRHQQRPRYGFYVDHMVDIFGSIALMAGLGFSGLLHWVTAVAMLIAFLLLASESYLATYTVSRFELSQGIFGPTEIRILLILGAAAALHNPYATAMGYKLLLFDLGGTIAAAAMFAMAIVVSVRHTRELYRSEPLP